LPKSYFKRKKEISELANDKFKIYEVEVEGKWWRKFI
jgi:hypothetical protein